MSQHMHKVKQTVIGPLPKTKLVWVDCTQKSPQSTDNNNYNNINHDNNNKKKKKKKKKKGKKNKKSEAKVLNESVELVQNTQEDKKVVSPLQSIKSIWVEKSSQLVQNGETAIPVTRSLVGIAEELPELLQDSESGSDEELEQLLPQTFRRKKFSLPVYAIPKHLRDLIERDKVPKVLFRPLSPSTYVDYFAALLYAEDYYIEKWTGYLISNATLELHKEKAKKGCNTSDIWQISDEEMKIYVKFEIDSIPERRPFLLSRDFVYLRHSGKKSEVFEGSLHRVMKSTQVLAEFGDDFYLQYSPNDRYDISFSFNRACLKRSHQAVIAAMNPSFRHVLFPTNSLQNIDNQKCSLVHKIATMQGPLPFLINSPLSMARDIVIKAVLQIYRNTRGSRILICAPKNKTCDFLASRLKTKIPNSQLFRANAAFREISDVDDDVRPLCSYTGECFEIPSLPELESFRVVTSTFVSSFRLYSCGITAGHFTHIFLVDASGGTEPECMIALANLVGEKTTIVVTGSARNHPDRVRSEIARRKGLRRSYFHKLLDSELYSSSDSPFAAHLEEEVQENKEL